MLNALLVPLATTLIAGAATPPVADVFVDANAVNCAAGIGSLVDPVCSIATAINLAGPGDTIRIAPGIYVENITIPFDLDLLGTGGASVTTIDGNFSGSVVTIPMAVTVQIDGLTVTRGLAGCGGGIKLSGDLVLRNSTVSNNRAVSGAGIASTMDGGGANLTIQNSVISSNLAIDDYYSPIGNPCEIGFGYIGAGGGIWQKGGTLSITNTTVSGNSAEADQGYCGSCTYVDATDRGIGGGIRAIDTMVSISDSIISDCSTKTYYGRTYGGGISLSGGQFEISNTTFSGNRAVDGMSLSFFTSGGAAASLSNVTIVTDDDSPAWPSIQVSDDSVEIRNSLVAGGTARVLGRLISLGHNLFQTGADGITNGVNGDLAGTPQNPLFVPLSPLADNGGPTLTHALVLGSPAIDAGDPITFEATDQRGVARPAFGLPDIGAFEADDLVQAHDLCSGTGGGFNPICADCPCGNNAPEGTIGGCLNSAGRSARIVATGDPSLSLPPGSTTDLRLTVTGATANAFSVMYSGDAVAPGGMMNPCFGMQTGVQSLAFDGLRCAILNTRRHGGRPSDSNGDIGLTNNGWGGVNGPGAGLGVQAGFVAGQTRYFQAEYREDSQLVCMRGLNTTQTVVVEFTP